MLRLALVLIAAAFAGSACAGDDPPFRIGGWKYQALSRGIHMSLCDNPQCEPGSKVSYVVSGVDANYSFEAFKSERAAIAVALKQRTSQGTTMEFVEPLNRSDKVFKIFQAVRHEKSDRGNRSIISLRVARNTTVVELISSASNLKEAEANLAPFMLAAMMVLTPTAAPPQ